MSFVFLPQVPETASVLVIPVIMASVVATFLRKQYLDSLATENNSYSADPILAKFEAIREKLEANITALTDHESVLFLNDLNNGLTDWRILKEQNKSMKKIFTCRDRVAPVNRSRISDMLDKVIGELERPLKASSSQPNLLLLERYTFYKPDQVTCIEDKVSDKLEKRMLDWLLTPSSDDFKAVGICGMGCSGKTALVKNVFKQKTVRDKFKRIIWACLSELTGMEEIDDWIIKYLLYRLGLDADVLLDNIGENKDWLMEEVERRLLNSGNYILVLDGMWHCSKWFAVDLLGKLRKNGGGAVIVTSRRKTVAEKIGDKNKLIHLSPSDSESAYKESAFFLKTRI